jgi:hypothetical protein
MACSPFGVAPLVERLLEFRETELPSLAPVQPASNSKWIIQVIALMYNCALTVWLRD